MHAFLSFIFNCQNVVYPFTEIAGDYNITKIRIDNISLRTPANRFKILHKTYIGLVNMLVDN